MEKRLRLLFDYQKYENNADLKAMIDAVHARYTARALSDDEVEFVAAAGMPETTLKKTDPKEEWP